VVELRSLFLNILLHHHHHHHHLNLLLAVDESQKFVIKKESESLNKVILSIKQRIYNNNI